MDYLPPVVLRLMADIAEYGKNLLKADDELHEFVDKAKKHLRDAVPNFRLAGAAAGDGLVTGIVDGAGGGGESVAAAITEHLRGARKRFVVAGERLAADIDAGLASGLDVSDLSLGEAIALLGKKLWQRASARFMDVGARLARAVGVGFGKALDPVVAYIRPYLTAAIDKIRDWATGPAMKLGWHIVTSIAGGITGGAGAVISAVRWVLNYLETTGRRIGQTISNAISRSLGTVSAPIKSFVAYLGRQLEGEIGQLLLHIGRKAAEHIVDGVKRALDFAGPAVTAAMKKMGNAVWSSLSSYFVSLGRRMVEGIADGLRSHFGGLLDRVKSSLSSFGSSFSSAVSGIFEKIPIFGTNMAASIASNPYIALGAAAIAVALAPVLVGAISAALTAALALGLGGGLLLIGGLILKDNEKLVNQAKKSFSSIKKTFVDAAQPLVGPFIDGLKAVQKIVKDLGPDFKALFTGVGPIVKTLTSGLGPMLKGILVGLTKAMPGINAAFSGLAKAMPRLGESIGNFFAKIFQNGPLVEKLTKGLVDFASSLLDFAGPAMHGFNVIFGAFTNLVHLGSKGLEKAWAKIKKAFDGGTGAIDRITAAWKPLKDAIKAAWKALEDFASASEDKDIAAKYETLLKKIKEIWAPLKEFLGTIWDEAWAFVKRKWDEKVVPWWNDTVKPYLEREVKAFVKKIFSSMVDDAVSSLLSLPGRAVGALGGLGSAIMGSLSFAFGGAASWLYNAGGDVVRGFARGIWDSIGQAIDAAVRMATSAVQAAMHILETRSPSKVFERIGRYTVEGFVQGIDRNAPTAAEAVMAMLSGGTPRFAPGAPGGFNGRSGAAAPAPGGGGPGYVPIIVNLGGTQMAAVHAQLIQPAQRHKARTGTTGLT